MAFIYPLHFSGTRWRVVDGDIYVSRLGSDLSGNGSPKKPYKTIQRAINQASAGSTKIVVGTGIYTEAVNGQNKSCRLVADGTVQMKGTTSLTAFSSMGVNSSLQGFVILNYQVAVNGTVKEIIGCVISSSLDAFKGTLRQSVILNATIEGSAQVRLINCTLIGVSSVSPAVITYLESCHLDSTTNLRLGTPASSYFDYCNQEVGSIVQISGNSYTTPVAVNSAFPTFQQHGLGVSPQFNRVVIGDYTLAKTSPLKNAGRRKTPIGAWGEAVSISTQEILSGGSISSVTIDSNNFLELPTGIYSGVIETPLIDLGTVKPVRTLRLFADQVFNETSLKVVSLDNDSIQPGAITVEMRYADDPADIVAVTYQIMTWDKIVSHDHRFSGNGQLSFEIRSTSYIAARCMQFRITLRNTEDAVLLVQENNDLLLQEDEREIEV